MSTKKIVAPGLQAIEEMKAEMEAKPVTLDRAKAEEMIRQQDIADEKACMQAIESICNEYGCILIPAVHIVGAQIRTSVFTQKKKKA